MEAATLAILLTLVGAGAAVADAGPTSPVQGRGKTCLDTLGDIRPPICHSHNASRILTEPDICLCSAGLRTVAAPYCEPGEAPAPQSAAAGRARLAAANAHGDYLEGRFEGRRFCLPRGRSSD